MVLMVDNQQENSLPTLQPYKSCFSAQLPRAIETLLRLNS